MRNIYIIRGKNIFVEEFQLKSYLPIETDSFYIYENNIPIELKKIGDRRYTFIYEESYERDYMLWDVDCVVYQPVNERQLKGLVIVTETLLEDVHDIYDIL